MVIRKPSSKKVLYALVFILSVFLGTFLVPVDRRPMCFRYLTFFLAALSLIAVSDLHVKKRAFSARVLFFAGFLVLGFLMAVRAQTGVDDPAYRRSYLRAATLSYVQYFKWSYFEIGYKTLTYFLHCIFGDNYNIAQLLITYLSIYLWGMAIKSFGGHSSVSAMSVVLITHYYLLIMGPALVRIFIAIPIVLYSLRFLWERNTRMYVIGILCAALFHLSSLFLLILIPFSFRGKWFYKNWHVVMLSILVAAPISFLFIAKVLVPLLPSAKYGAYATIRGLSLSLGKFDMVPIWIIGYINFRHVEDKNKDMYTIAMVLISLSIIISIFSSMVSVGRLIYYANLGVVLLFGMMWKQSSGNRLHPAFMCALTLYTVVYMFHSGFLNPEIRDYLFNYRMFY